MKPGDKHATDTPAVPATTLWRESTASSEAT